MPQSVQELWSMIDLKNWIFFVSAKTDFFDIYLEHEHQQNTD